MQRLSTKYTYFALVVVTVKNHHLFISTAYAPPPWMFWRSTDAFVVNRAGDIYEGHEEDSRTKAAAVHHAPGAIYFMLYA